MSNDMQVESPDFFGIWKEIVEHRSDERCVGDKKYKVCNDRGWKWLCEELGKGTDGCQLANAKAYEALKAFVDRLAPRRLGSCER